MFRSLFPFLALVLTLSALRPSNAAPKSVFPLTAGDQLSLRAALTPSRIHYFQENGRDIEVEIRPTRLYPLFEEIKGIEVLKIWQDTDPIGNRTTIEPGKRPVVTASGRVLHKWIFKVKHPSLGKAEFVIRARDERELLDQDHLSKILGTFFKTEKLPETPRYRRNPASDLVHYAASGHQTAGDIALSDADPRSRRCKLCFPKINRLAFLDEELLIQAQLLATIRQNFDGSSNSALQTRVAELGQRVLSNWPFPLKGYDYQFAVIKNGGFNAYACPAGYVFLTEAILETLESDEELESILAHEIAHVEMRHSLKELYRLRQAAAGAQIFGAIAQVGIGAVAAHNNVDGATAANLGQAAGLISSAIVYQILEGNYSEEQEKEADLLAAMYLQKNNKSRDSLLNVLAKIRTEQNNRGQSPRIANGSHPAIDERLFIVSNCKATFMEQSRVFDLIDADDESLCSVALIAICDYKEKSGNSGSKVFTEIETLIGIGESAQVKSLDLRHKRGVISFASEQLVALPPLSAQSVVFTRSGANPIADAELELEPTIPGLKAKRSVPRSR
jgi:Zn-dependent protease with chaperone function